MRNMFLHVALLLGAFACAACSSKSEVSSDSNPGSLGGAGGSSPDASADASGGSGAADGGASGAGGAAGAGNGGASGSGGVAGSAGASGAGGMGGSGTGGSAGASSGGAAGAATGGSGGGAPTSCLTDADCSGGTSCQVTPNDTATALELKCMPLAGANGKGVACTASTECRSGQCLYGFCSAPCSASSDCTQAGSCRTETVTSGSLSGDFSMCVVLPCTSASQCDPGEVCSDIRSANGVMAAYCRQGNPAGAPVGDPCTANADCASALCPSWLLFCTGACASDSDCGSAAELGCVDVFGDGTSIVQACAPLCSSQADCGTSSTCAIATDSVGNQHRFICSPGYGTDPVGADCSTVNQCASGLCLTNYNNGQLVDQICTAPCANGATDCPAGYQTCKEITMYTPDGNGTETIGLCDHP